MNRSLFSTCRSALLVVVAALLGQAMALAQTVTTYPDYNVDPAVTEWNATPGIAAGDTVILENNSTSTASGNATVNNGTLQFNNSAAFNSPYEFGLAMSGTGVVQAISGTTSLTGTNSYTGGTTIDSGAALIVTTSSLPGAVTNDGVLRFQQDTNGTFAGAITGTGGIIQRYGAGTVTLTGTNSQAFEIYNDPFGGRLVGNTDSLKGTIQNNGGTLEFNQTSNGTFIGSFGTFDTGFVYKTGPGDLTLTGNNRLQAGGQSDLFVQAGRVVGAGESLDFNGTIDISNGAELRIDEPVGGFTTPGIK